MSQTLPSHLPNLGPVFKPIIHKQIVLFLIAGGRLNRIQHGFRGGRSCLSALLHVFDDIMLMLNGSTSIDMIYLDFYKAFNKVNHGILLHKVKVLGPPQTISDLND